MNHRLLIEDLSSTIDDDDILRLIEFWLDAGVLDGIGPAPDGSLTGATTLAGANMAVRDAVNNLLDEFLSNRLGVEGDLAFSAEGNQS